MSKFNLVSVVFVVLFVVSGLFGFGMSSSLAAGWGYGGNNLCGGFSLDNGVYYNSGMNGGEAEDGGLAGSFYMCLDPTKMSFENANWNFYTSWYDPSWWTASCYLHGLRDSTESYPNHNYWSQSIDQGGVTIQANLNFSCYEGGGVGRAGGDPYPVLELGGGINIAPSHFGTSNFQFAETEDQIYSWPNGYENDPVITLVPSWQASYELRGQFVAPTLAQAQAMGAPFVQTVPEPGSMLMLALGAGVVGAVLCIRRRR